MAITTYTLKAEPVRVNFSTFGLIFTASKFLSAARHVVEQERFEEGGWHPVGKYLTCHSIELSLKAFLTLKGETLSGARRFLHRIADLLDETEQRNLHELVTLTDDEKAEIRKASRYYSGKVFEYPYIAEAAVAYPCDPDVTRLIGAAGRLVDGLYDPCKAA